MINTAARAMIQVATRTGWGDLPGPVRSAIHERTGEVRHTTTVSTGLNAAFTARLRTDTGLVFAKGVPSARAYLATRADDLGLLQTRHRVLLELAA